MPRRPTGSARAVSPRNQRIPSVRALTSFLREAQAAVRLRGQVTVLLTTDAAIRRLNRQFRGKNKATDVLSFPAASGPVKIAGDLAISVPTARRQAVERRHSLSIEIKVLLFMGCFIWPATTTRSIRARWIGSSRRFVSNSVSPTALLNGL